MMRPQKALHVVIRAMADVVKSRSDAHLVIVGDGQCRRKLQTLADDLELNNHVHFMGIRDNVAGLLAESDCAALSSDYEGMPLFILESLAVGTPVVATNVGAVGQLIEDGQTGFLVPKRDPRRMADCIIRVLNDPVGYQYMSATCKSRAEKYSIKAVAQQFDEFYTAIAYSKGVNQ
ncbi:hypothetical protein A5762_00380 [Mycolicibacterium elephantis]|nr:hypothetical protein A5762_00380 [Mycolicibacterium elephantis]